MKRVPSIKTVAFLSALLAVSAAASAQQSETPGAAPQSQPGFSPAPPGAVPAGTRFLIETDDSLDTKTGRAGNEFSARTLEPLIATDGRSLPAGAIIRGHIDKCESAHQAGRARLWLTFDTISTLHGRAPLVAELIDAPGVHSIRVAYDHEGEILAASDKRQQAELAAAAGALTGAAAGVASKDARDAATGAAIGALTAFLITSGLGQDIFLPEQTKLEIVLTRPLLLYAR